VLATRETLDIMAVRYGARFADTTQAVALGERLRLDGTTVSFHPAGHVLGSAQIRIEGPGLGTTRRIVVSGDYKRQIDPTAAAYEPVACDVFITEATFGLPVFRHPDAAREVARLIASCALFPDRAHLVGAYALGKAQRVIALLRANGYDRPIYLHGAMERLCRLYTDLGIALGDLRPVRGLPPKTLAGEIILCPPGSMADLWSRKLPDPVTAFASGWMRVRARARQRGVELPLVISDHCDWDDLQVSIRETGASEVWVTHGQEDALVHWCQSIGLAARPLNLIGYGDDGEAEPDAAGPAAPDPSEATVAP
jgi:putative mRNA 3-end processing factor